MGALRKPARQEAYREQCQDEDGNRYVVIVWRSATGVTSYTLEDGTPVHYDDECYFTIVSTGRGLTRCED